MKKNQKIEKRIASIELIELGLIYIKHKDIEEFPTFDEIKKIVDDILIIADGNQFVFISDFRDMFQNWSSESKEYVTKHKKFNELIICQAIIVNTLPLKLLINIFISFNKPPNPIKVFSNYKDAVAWTKSIKEELKA